MSKQTSIAQFFQVTKKKEEVKKEPEFRECIDFLEVNQQKLQEYMIRNGGEESFNVYKNLYVQTLIKTFRREISNEDLYMERFFYEMELIERNEFFEVFLQVHEILHLTSQYPHIIRGSAGSSFICYLMGITNIDPIAENIPLTRFMHERRQDIPDIDIDFPAHVRDEIFQMIYERWEGRVARISNHVRFKEKSALKEAIRRTGYHKMIPKEFDLKELIDDPAIQYQVLEEADSLEGEFRCYSLHCGGIVIFRDKVPDEYYLQDYQINRHAKTFEKPILGAQLKLNKDEAEDFHLIKIDILSNRGLSQLWDISQMPIDQYPLDEEVFRLFSRGDTIGLTYGESRGMCKIFKEMKPKNIEDIACALALIRPAASKNGQKFNFLKDYYQMGVAQRDDFLIYDDDAIQLIARLLQISHSEADLYRKGFAKNRYHVKKEFKMKMDEINRETMTAEKRQLIYEQLECLQEYSFCKSHAFSYAQLLYALAYQKHYHPKQFWEATLRHCHSSYRTWVHYREAKKAGVDIRLFGRGKSAERLKTRYMKEKSSVDEYFTLGYWLNETFLPNMYFRNLGLRDVGNEKEEDEEEGKKKKPKKKLPFVEFRGLIVTYKIFEADRYIKKREENKEARKSPYLTFVTLGYEDGQYMDIVLWGMYKLSKCHCLSGDGFLEDSEGSSWIRAKRVHIERLE